MRNGSLWSDVVFEKEVILPRIWFWDLRKRFLGLEVKHLKSHNFLWQGWFFFHYYLATSTTNWAKKFHRFVILCICWDTPSEKTGLWQCSVLPVCDINIALYSNFVKEGVQEHQSPLNHLSSIVFFVSQTSKYLENSPCKLQNPDCIREFMKAVETFNITK